MTNELFLYGEKSYPVIKRDGKEFADFGEKGLKLLKRNESGELVKGFPGREPGSSNGTMSNGATSHANGSHNGGSKATIAPDSGLWAKVRAIASKRLNVSPDNVGIIVTNKTVTVNVNDELLNPRTKKSVIYALCTWSVNLQEWLSGKSGVMSPATSVQDFDTLADIHGVATMLDDCTLINEWYNKLNKASETATESETA